MEIFVLLFVAWVLLRATRRAVLALLNARPAITLHVTALGEGPEPPPAPPPATPRRPRHEPEVEEANRRRQLKEKTGHV